MNLKYKIALLSFMCGGGLLLAQSQYSVEQVENSSNPQMIANFIKYNPNHPKTPILKEKLSRITNDLGGKFSESKEVVYTVSPMPKNTYTPFIKSPYIIKSSDNEGNKVKGEKTADLLNHLFDNNPNKKKASITIVNNSPCDIVVYFSGAKNYTLDVGKNTKNFILVDKGSYSITSDVCNAKYSARTLINKDMSTTLNYRSVPAK